MRTWEILYEHEEKLLCCEGEVALEQALEQPQGGCGVSFPGDIKKNSGNAPVKSTLGNLLNEAGKLYQVTSRGLFCDSQN